MGQRLQPFILFQSNKFSRPFFFFRVTIGDLHEQSGMMYAQDKVEMELKKEDGSALGNKKFKTTLASGEIKEGTIDGSGKAKIEKVQPGIADITIDLNT